MKKWRNKITGEINEFMVHKRIEDSEDGNPIYAPFDGRIEEDYEEPKEFYVVENRGTVGSRFRTGDEYEKTFKAIGNYFETEKEAKKAVEKLKAWKRLKDKGFRFNRWTIPEEPKTKHIKLVIEAEIDVPDSPYDLDLLFSGEDD